MVTKYFGGLCSEIDYVNTEYQKVNLQVYIV